MNDADLFVPLTRANPAAPKPKCKRHDWVRNESWNGGPTDLPPVIQCVRCNAIKDPAASRRSRNNKCRGNRIQRQRIEGLGGQNLPGNKPNHDGIGVAFSYESKSGSPFSERYWRWLTGIPVTAMQTAVLIVTEAPGPGRRARSYVVVEYDDWRDLHGETL